MKKILSILYLVLLLGIYSLIPLLFITYNINNHSEDSLLFLSLGIATVFNYFITVYIRGFLLYKIKPKFSENDLIIKIFNLLLLIISSGIIYLIFNKNGLDSVIVAKVLIVYVIASYIVISVECKNNRKIELHKNISYFIKKKESILKYILIPLISSLICVTPSFILIFINAKDIKEISKILFSVLLGMHILIIIVSYLYSKITYNVLYKNNNKEHIIYKPAVLYYEMFLYIFPIIHFIIIWILTKYYEKIINIQLVHSCYFLIFTFVIVIITNKIQKRRMFNGVYVKYSMEELLLDRISNKNQQKDNKKEKSISNIQKDI